MTKRWLISVGAALTAAFFGLLDSRAADGLTEGKRDTPVAAEVPRRDAVSDPLLLLLRAPVIRERLGLEKKQIESLDRAIDEMNDPLWRLRDAQFLNIENSTKAWQLIGGIESKLGSILERGQHARLRQLVIQARGLDALLDTEMIEELRLAPSQAKHIAEILEATRKEAMRLQKEASGNSDAERNRQAEQLLVDRRKQLVALLSDAQMQQLKKLAGDPFDFSRVPRRFTRAPEIGGVEAWINSAPLRPADLRGKVVALHFFTFGCINCIHNQPAYKDWHERFPRRDFVVLGIHTPEGESDRILENIRTAIQKQKIEYPVAVDNEKANWNAWANHVWPSVYLIDKEGYVRYWWYGELNWKGAQGENQFREKIAELIAESIN